MNNFNKLNDFDKFEGQRRMKNMGKFIIIFCIISFFLGLVLFVVSIVLKGGLNENLIFRLLPDNENVTVETREFDFSASKLDNLELSFIASQISVKITGKNESNKVKVKYSKLSNCSYDEVASDGVLKIIEDKKSGISNYRLKNDISVCVEIPENVKLGEVALKSVSGDIKYDFDTCKTVKIITLSGNVYSNGKNAEQGDISTTSGDVEISGYNISNKLMISSMSGKIKLNKANSKKIILDETSGDINMNEIKIQESCEITSVSGNIVLDLLENEDNYNIRASSVSGDINVFGKSINRSYSSDSGDVSVRCNTTSGNIEIR